MAIRNWPSKVSWAKFKKIDTPPRGAGTDAHIEVLYSNPPGKRFKVVKEGKYFRLANVHFVLKLVPARTWVVKGKESKDLLRHEQGHWDIVGLLAREYQREIKKLRGDSVSQLKARFRKLEARVQAKGERLNTGAGLYDTQTDHGRNKAQQKRWDALIASCMRSREDLPAR